MPTMPVIPDILNIPDRPTMPVIPSAKLVTVALRWRRKVGSFMKVLSKENLQVTSADTQCPPAAGVEC